MKSTRRIGVLVAAAAIALGVPGTALADTPGPTIFADMNNDGIPDQVSFAQVGGPQSTTCSVTVSFGLPGGGFGAPHVHDYTSAERQAPFCPDLAVAMKLGNDKRPDLVTGFSFGGQDLVALHDFTPSAVFIGINQPNWLRTADLNGDGRPDLIEASMQSEFLVTKLNTAAGTLVPGPFSACVDVHGTERPQYALADFNGDGGQDMLLSTDCPNDPVPQKAEVLFGNGQATAVLDMSTDFSANWTVFSIDLDHDGIPDAGVIETSSAGVTVVKYFHNDGTGHFTQVAGP